MLSGGKLLQLEYLLQLTRPGLASLKGDPWVGVLSLSVQQWNCMAQVGISVTCARCLPRLPSVTDVQLTCTGAIGAPIHCLEPLSRLLRNNLYTLILECDFGTIASLTFPAVNCSFQPLDCLYIFEVPAITVKGTPCPEHN